MKRGILVISLSVMVPAFGAEVLTRDYVRELLDKEQDQVLWDAVNGAEDTKKLIELLNRGISPNHVCLFA